MTQLILNGILLPQTSFDRYAAWEEVLTRQVTMISGRQVVEAIGTRNRIWRLRWSYDYLDNETTRQVLSVLRQGGPVPADFLPDNGDALIPGVFLVSSVTQPTFLIDDGGRPVWHELAFELREERPHD